MFITKCHCPHHSESCVHTHLAVYPDAGSVGWPSLERLAQGLMWPSEVVRYDLATPGPDKYRANSKVVDLFSSVMRGQLDRLQSYRLCKKLKSEVRWDLSSRVKLSHVRGPLGPSSRV